MTTRFIFLFRFILSMFSTFSQNSFQAIRLSASVDEEKEVSKFLDKYSLLTYDNVNII